MSSIMNSVNNTQYKYTPEYIQQYLSKLQHHSTLSFIPALVYLCLLTVMGSVGNCLVLVIYSTKMRKTPLRAFIVYMAILDLPTNILVIPGEIYDMFHVWDFNLPTVCKVRRYLNAFLVSSSLLVLVAIAITRYKMVCRPFEQQITLNQARLITSVMVGISFVWCIPYAMINGSQTIETPYPQIFGHFCQVDDSYVDTIWPTMNSAFFIFIIVSCCLIMVTFYCRIGVWTWQRRKAMVTKKAVSMYYAGEASKVSDNVSTANTCGIEEHSEYRNEDLRSGHECCSHSPSPLAPELTNKKAGSLREMFRSLQNIQEKLNDSASSCDDKLSSLEKGIDKIDSFCGQPSLKRSSIFNKTTWMLIMVSFVFVLGFFPFVALNFYKTAAPKSFASLEGLSLSLYHLFLRSHLLNSAVNPVVYSFLDIKFRKECYLLFKCFLKK